MWIFHLSPRITGEMNLKTDDIHDYPQIIQNFLQDDKDYEDVIEGETTCLVYANNDQKVFLTVTILLRNLIFLYNMINSLNKGTQDQYFFQTSRPTLIYNTGYVM